MLTTTYAFLSLSMEQKKLHTLLFSAQQLLQINSDRQRLDDETLKSVVKKFARLAAACRKRKLEMYVVPAIQNATHQFDQRLSDMASSRIIARQLLDRVKSWARPASHENDDHRVNVYAAIERACNQLRERLAMEEKELLPIAQRVISNDQWFALGAQFLVADTARKPYNGSRREEYAKVDSRDISLNDPLISLAVSGYAYSH
ncbi:hypothetical protein [Glaciimonas sp. PAMC28666]|uniref:hypothetical protein n=1 Tax=Glaciimonas sp. PAMC28666 TaxID=2807626 RepID=UPI0019645ABD|nr:hypothetical protein [Glaciimonas sp. PAMC28666]QRX83745.1 hypothetical protein JQN73_05825 [Glaciimonas sp. PAMC28666]